MRVFLDTTVVIDVLARRLPFFEDSRWVLDFCKNGPDIGLISTLSYANVAYVLRKYADFDQMIAGVSFLHQFFETAPMEDSTVSYAIESGNRDFEDAMQYEAALSAGADVIVTRNPRDFADSEIRVMTPGEFLSEFPA